MASVVCNDFDDCNVDNLQNKCSIVSFDESESYSLLTVLQRSCTETNMTRIDAHDVISVKHEEDRDIDLLRRDSCHYIIFYNKV